MRTDGRHVPFAGSPRAGFITITTVIVLMTVAVAAALTAILTAWQTTDGQFAWLAALRAQGLADACAETARASFWSDRAYAGSESFSFPTGRCAILPVTGASLSYDVRAEGSSGGAIARTLVHYEMTVDASGSVQAIDATAFERVEDF